MKDTVRQIVILAALSLSIQSMGHAQSITVNDASFEGTTPNIPNANGAFTNNVVAGWTGTGTAADSYGVFAPTTTPYPSGVPNGSQVGYVNSGSIYQDVAATVTANTYYTLTGYFGHRADFTNPLGSFNLETSGGTILATSGSITAPSGKFAFETVIFTALPSNPNLGSGLRIVLTETGQQANFDQIQLTANSTTPEPGVMSMFIGAGLVGIKLALRRRTRRK